MEITIIPDKSEYYPGEILKGKVKLFPESKTSIKDIEISLYLIEDWNHLRSDKKYETSNNTQCVSLFYVRINLVFIKPENTFIDLEPREYIFSFEEKLPDYLLPSFEYPQNKFRAFVRYSLTAKVVPDAHISNSTFINILSVPKKEDIESLSMGTSLNAKKKGLFKNGETSFKVNYPTKNYKIYDKIPIDVEIDNTNSKMKVTECKFKLMRKITFRDKEDFCDKYFQEDKLIRKVFPVNVNKKEKKNYNFNLDLSEISFKDFNYDGFTDPYKGTKNIKDLIPSIDGNILSCEYTIIVMLKFDSHVKKDERPKIVLPIYIVQKLDNDHIIKAQDEIKRLKINEEEEKNNIIINDQNDIGNNFINENKNENENNINEFDNYNNNGNNGYNPYNNIDLDYRGNNNKIIIDEKKENNYIENRQNIQNVNDEDDDYELPSRETLDEIYKNKEDNIIINNNNININNDSNGFINKNNFINNKDNFNINKYNENININNYDKFNSSPNYKMNLGNDFNSNNNINNINNIDNNNNLSINNKNMQNMGNNINSNNNDKNDDDEDYKVTDINLFGDDDDDDDDDDNDNKKNDEQNKNKIVDINNID